MDYNRPFTLNNKGRPMSITTTNSGLQYEDTVVGSGAEAKAGNYVTVHYTGWLQNDDGSTGVKFDSSKDRNDPFEFPLLKDSEQFSLEMQRQVADFIKKKRAAVGKLEAPLAGGNRAGEGAFFMPEKFGL